MVFLSHGIINFCNLLPVNFIYYLVRENSGTLEDARDGLTDANFHCNGDKWKTSLTGAP